MKKLLGIFAHPDDESFTAGGTIAKYVKAGWQVDLVCATHGDVVKPGEETGPQHKGDVRKKELEEAAAQLGVTSITFLEYTDEKLSLEKPGEIEDKLASLLAEFKPDVIVTIEPSGITNNPDHMKLTLTATFAFQQYAWMRHEEHPDDAMPPKLYFGCMPGSVVSYLQKNAYIPEESFGKPWRGVDDKRITTVIDIKRFAAVKARALRAHASQSAKVNQYLGIPHNPLQAQEFFILRMEGIRESFMGKNDRVSDRL